MKTEWHVLNLGAGVQSTALALLAARGELGVTIDCAVFADTGEEPIDPGENVYEHLRWLMGQVPFPIIVRAKDGRLGDHLLRGVNSTGGRFASIPAFTLRPDGTEGKVRRQCTKEYKVEVIERAIRRDVLGLAPRKHVPRGVQVHQYIGISLDEAGRMISAKRRALEKPVRWSVMHYPLCEGFGEGRQQWTRAECRRFLAPLVPHRVPRSACTFCPYHSDEEWARIKARGGADWARVVEIDRALRVPGNVVNRKLNQQMYLHRSCRPIEEVDFSAPENRQGEFEMAGECEGMCGH
jgi:hypothetical protein